MDIALIQPGTDKGFQNFEAVPPIGLLSIYSALPEEYRNRTYFLDGNLVSTQYISSWLRKNKPKIVGISSLTFGYKNAIGVGEVAQEIGATTVLGGRHATDVRANILRRMNSGHRPFDYLVSGEGEIIFKKMIKDYFEKEKIGSQPNLYIPQDLNKSPRREQKSGFDFRFPVLDYSMLTGETSPEEYMKNLGRIGILNDVDLSMPIISQRGCAYLGEKSHCKFCSIPRVNPKLPYDVFGPSLENLLVTTNADHIWFTEGDFTASKKHLGKVSEKVRDVREKTGKEFSIYCFTRADDLLREGVVDLLHEMGVKAVFIGYEHGNNKLLEAMNKGTTKSQNLKATKRLSDRGIEVTCGGIVLGTPGETNKTLEDAIQISRELASVGNVKSIFASPVYPFPGAPYWNEFIDALTEFDKQRGEDLKSSDILEEETLVESFQEVAYMMPGGTRNRASLKEIMAAKEEISNLLGKGIQFTEKY